MARANEDPSMSDEAENRIQKKLGIEFKKGLNSNLIPTCLVFIDLKKD